MRRLFYSFFGWKKKDIDNLKELGKIVDGKVDTKITPDGFEQNISLQLNDPVEFITVTIDPGKVEND